MFFSDKYAVQLTENNIESIVNYDIEVIKDILKNEIKGEQKSKEQKLNIMIIFLKILKIYLYQKILIH